MEIPKFNRVVVPEPNTRYDVSSADRFGPLSYISHTQLNPFDPDDLFSRVASGLNKVSFHPENDALCLTGNTLTLALVLGFMMSCYPSLNVLMYDLRTEEYELKYLKYKGLPINEPMDSKVQGR